MEHYIELSNKNSKKAKDIINGLNIIQICKGNGFEAHLIGSVSTNLLMNSNDIDFHIYSQNYQIEIIFAIIGEIAGKMGIYKAVYQNFLSTDDRSIDWHLNYKTIENEDWEIDLIFIRNDSPYVGRAEEITRKINSTINENTRNRVLKLKWELDQKNEEYKGIEIYKAVLENGIYTVNDFLEWKSGNPNMNLWSINPRDE
jgi:hypothetical protein